MIYFVDYWFVYGISFAMGYSVIELVKFCLVLSARKLWSKL